MGGGFTGLNVLNVDISRPLIQFHRLFSSSSTTLSFSRTASTFSSRLYSQSYLSRQQQPPEQLDNMRFRRMKDEPKEAAKAAAPTTRDSEPSTALQPSASTSSDAGVHLMASIPAPPLDVRWVHTGSKILDLPTVPITTNDIIFKPFSVDENTRLEKAWNALPIEKRNAIVARWGVEDGEWGQKAKRREEKQRLKDQKKEQKKDAKSASSRKNSHSKVGEVPSRPETPPAAHSAAQSAIHSDAETTTTTPPERVNEADQYRSIIEQAQNDPERLDKVKGVPIAQDSLFEVDFDTLSVHPVFWPQTGPRIPVIRGTWFMGDETKPCTWCLAKEIEKGYQDIKPWLPSYQDELRKAMAIGPSGEEKLKYPLPAKYGEGLAVLFEDDGRCRIIASGAFDYMSRYILSSMGSKPTGTYFYRGFNTAATAKEMDKAREKAAREEKDRKKKEIAEQSKEKKKEIAQSKEPETAKTLKDAKDAQAKTDDDVPDSLQSILDRVKNEFETKKKSLEEANAPVLHARNDDEPCTDLILVVHGIGQHLAAQYESFNFIYASNQLRQVLRKQSMDPALASVMRDKRFQILPVQWRANLKLESETLNEDEQNEKANVFTIADITIGKSIPYVRQLTNSVLLDIPLFMSGHKRKMIEAVCQQANRLYRLWIARHPEFEKYGRVHIIGHSLGSALATEILSHQPTTVPPLSQLPKQVIEETTNRFLFNTKNLFLVGSPVGVFLQLQQAHIIARAGRERTMDALPDEAYTLPGRFGCMAIDNLYNIFYPTDPIAYALNPAVDVSVAKERPPIAIPSVNTSVFDSLPSMPSMPSMPPLPSLPPLPTMPNVSKYLPTYFGSSEKKDKGSELAQLDSPHPDEIETTAIEIELVAQQQLLEGSKGERRFAALNPRGALDYALPSSSVNDYIDMITAHGNYWNDNSFGAFVLNETFANLTDEARTGTGPEKKSAA